MARVEDVLAAARNMDAIAEVFKEIVFENKDSSDVSRRDAATRYFSKILNVQVDMVLRDVIWREINKTIDDLVTDGFLEGRSMMAFTSHGYIHYFGNHEIKPNLEKSAAIPAADRFVGLDDNIEYKNNAIDALEKLTKALQDHAPNDLFARAEERLAVISQVQTLAQQLKQITVRGEVILNAVGKSSVLRWLAGAAAGGIIGTYAVEALDWLSRLASALVG